MARSRPFPTLVALAALVALLAGAAWLALRSLTAVDGGVLAGPRGEPPPAGIEGAELRGPAVSTEVEPARAAVASASAPVVWLPEEERARSKWLVSGTFAVRRADGTLDAHGDGTLRWSVRIGNQGHRVDVHAREGAWSVDLGADEAAGGLGSLLTSEAATVEPRLSLEEAHFEGVLLAVMETQGQLALPRAEPIEVLALEPPVTLLRVMDARTRVELDRFRLFEAMDGESHPGIEVGGLGEDLASPVDLAALFTDRLGARSLLVGARGYAWTSAALDVSAGGERVVPLEPGGGLLVELAGATHHPDVELRAWREDAEVPHFAFRLEGRTDVRLEGLAPGHYTLRAELGPWFQAPLLLGEADVDVVAGAEARVVLAVEPAPHAERGDANILVLVDPRGRLDGLRFTMELIDVALDSGTHVRHGTADRLPEPIEGCDAFTALQQDLPAGRHELVLDHPAFRVVADIRPEALNEVRVTVPPPGELVVRVVDAASGADLPDARVGWSAPLPEGVWGAVQERAERDDRLRHRIRAPQGTISISARADGHVSEHLNVVLSDVPQERVVQLARATEVEVALIDGDARVPFPDTWNARIQNESSEPVEAAETWGMEVRRYSLPSGGTYHFELPDIPGYEPIPDHVHDAPAGERSVLQVRLRRLP